MRCIALCFLVAAAALSEQSPPEPTFRTGTNLVQVSVVAQNKDGKPVADLRREDFQILDNGTPQDIRLFLLQKPDAEAPAAKTTGVFRNRVGMDKTSAHSVFLFDNLNIDPGNTAFAHTARARIKAMTALRAIPPGDEIAIFALWCRFQVIRNWTADRDSMLAGLEKFAPAPDGCRKPPDTGEHMHSVLEHQFDRDYARYVATRYNAPPTTAELGAGELPPPSDLNSAQASSMEAANFAVMMQLVTDRQISQLADYLAEIPGRKNLIWIAANFPLLKPTIRKLIDADVAIYPVDTLGSQIALQVFKDERAAQLRGWATATGGKYYTDRDDLDVAIEEAMNDGRTSYILGFYPSNPDRDVSEHRIEVRTDRPGVNLRYRTTYAVAAPVAPPPPKSTSPVRDLVLAMKRPVDSTAIGIAASVTHAAPRLLNVAVTFDISNLNLEFNQGQWTGSAEFVSRFVTDDDKQAGDATARTMTFHLKPATYAAMLQHGYLYREHLTVPQKAAELYLAIGNLTTGKVGTLTIPLSEVDK